MDIGANKQCFAPNLLYLKLINCNYRNLSHFKQTLKKSPHQPSTIDLDRFEKRLDWCHKADENLGTNTKSGGHATNARPSRIVRITLFNTINMPQTSLQ